MGIQSVDRGAYGTTQFYHITSPRWPSWQFGDVPGFLLCTRPPLPVWGGRGDWGGGGGQPVSETIWVGAVRWTCLAQQKIVLTLLKNARILRMPAECDNTRICPSALTTVGQGYSHLQIIVIATFQYQDYLSTMMIVTDITATADIFMSTVRCMWTLVFLLSNASTVTVFILYYQSAL